MDINPKHLDAALNVLGVAMNIPLNTLVFNLHNALSSAHDEGVRIGYERGFIDATIEADEDFEVADVQHEGELRRVGEEQYEDGYVDAVHDFKVCPEAAIDRANEIEDERDFVATAVAMDPTLQV